jgi:hypothetical protein
LWHFKLRAELALPIDPQLSVRRLHTAEIGIVEEHLGSYGVIHPEYGIEFRREEERPEFPSETLGKRYSAAVDDWLSKVDIDAGYAHAKKVIEAMRLFASGDVGTQFFMNLLPDGGSETGNPYELSSEYVDSEFVMDSKAAAGFAPFWRQYSAWNPRNVGRHLNRFLRAYRQDNWYDRLIDFVISAEGLVLPGVTQELRYQFSLRTAWLLGSGGSERQKIFRQAQKIYDLRSKIVHGQAGSETEKEITICHLAGEINRRLLVKSMEEPALIARENLEALPLGS